MTNEPVGAGAPLTDLALALGHVFADASLLADAVAHPSLMGLGRRPPHHGVSPYERLEFLGDRVLGLAIAEWLLDRFPDEKEGALAKRHAALVNRDCLAAMARIVDLGRYLRLSPAEEAGGGRQNGTILADACEAVIGAVYLDGGFEPARRFIRRIWEHSIERETEPPVEAKTALQEWAQGRGLTLPAYEMIERTGPDHDPVFRVKVTVESAGDTIGSGSSKRAAEKDAARRMLKELGVSIHE